jgi:multimeric flavodoxin WrbA
MPEAHEERADQWVPNGQSDPLVLAIMGSPRQQGHTEVLLRSALDGAAAAGARTELVSLRSLQFAPCRACHACDRTGTCVVQDDMQQVYAKLGEARHIMLASPIQFSGVSAQTKAMIDRAQCCWVATYRLGRGRQGGSGERRGVFIATCGGSDARVFEWAKPPVKAFLNSTGFAYWGELFEMGTDEPPPVSERHELLRRADQLGRELIGPT